MLQIAVFYFEEHTSLFLELDSFKTQSDRCMKRSHSDMTVTKGSCGWKDSISESFFLFATLGVEDKGYE